jgi:hypothetical protein
MFATEKGVDVFVGELVAERIYPQVFEQGVGWRGGRALSRTPLMCLQAGGVSAVVWRRALSQTPPRIAGGRGLGWSGRGASGKTSRDNLALASTSEH